MKRPAKRHFTIRLYGRLLLLGSSFLELSNPRYGRDGRLHQCPAHYNRPEHLAEGDEVDQCYGGESQAGLKLERQGHEQRGEYEDDNVQNQS